MPTALLRTYDASGIKTFDTTEASGGCVVDVDKEIATTQTKNYPAFTGRTATIICTSGWNTAVPTISYVNGYPSVTYPAYTYSNAAAFWLMVVI